jgi:hypothetical protein
VEDLGKVYVTIVSGLPRSGTSMMMQMLAAGGMPVLADDVRRPDPHNPRGYLEFDPVKRTAKDPAWLAGAAGRAVKVVHLLLLNLPVAHEYRVIFMNRDLDEVLASQAAMLVDLGRRGADLSGAKLAEAFDAQLRRVRTWLADQPNFSVLDVNYREVIDDPAGQATRVNHFLGDQLEETRMIAAVDRSLYRHRSR